MPAPPKKECSGEPVDFESVPASPPPTADYYILAEKRIYSISKKIKAAGEHWVRTGLLSHLDQSLGSPALGGGSWSKHTLKACYTGGTSQHERWIRNEIVKRKAEGTWTAEERERKRKKWSLDWEDVVPDSDGEVGDNISLTLTAKEKTVNPGTIVTVAATAPHAQEEQELAPASSDDDIPLNENELVRQRRQKSKRLAEAPSSSLTPIFSSPIKLVPPTVTTATPLLLASLSTSPTRRSNPKPSHRASNNQSSPLFTVQEADEHSRSPTASPILSTLKEKEKSKLDLDHSQSMFRTQSGTELEIGMLSDRTSTTPNKNKGRVVGAGRLAQSSSALEREKEWTGRDLGASPSLETVPFSSARESQPSTTPTFIPRLHPRPQNPAGEGDETAPSLPSGLLKEDEEEGEGITPTRPAPATISSDEAKEEDKTLLEDDELKTPLEEDELKTPLNAGEDELYSPPSPKRFLSSAASSLASLSSPRGHPILPHLLPLNEQQSLSKSSFRKILASQGKKPDSSVETNALAKGENASGHQDGGSVRHGDERAYVKDSQESQLPDLSGVRDAGDSYSQFMSQMQMGEEIEGFLNGEVGL
ncbi:hypothetical protein BT69DRAFT_1300579 [Atractiella rhizophila]|nr:hypothetical protein BT69DRAFT_1300579 [Atractiella rhizophila]